MWGGEKIENEIERLVKILTKCKMKLKSRREEINEIVRPGWPRLERCFASLPPFIISVLLFLLPVPPASVLHRLAYPPPRIGRISPPAILAPAVPLFPSFFIKLPKQQSVAVIAWRGVQLVGSAVVGFARRHPCSFIQSDGRDSAPVPMASFLWRAEL